MNVIRLMGGIGNQFFQYAFGRVFQKNGKEVAYDTSWYSIKQIYPRPYRLDKFQTNIKFNFFIIGNPTRIGGAENYEPEIFSLDNHNFDGYWQHLRYYTGIRPALQKELTLRPEFHTEGYLHLAQKISNSRSVSIHVRRGDYLKLWPVIMSVNYYANAIQRTEGDLFIFSDDIPWCRKAFRQEYLKREITFIDIEDYLAFELMRLCRQKILGNSTFSWWAAFLSDGLVICPRDWLGFRNTFDEDERYPKEWIRLENE